MFIFFVPLLQILKWCFAELFGCYSISPSIERFVSCTLHDSIRIMHNEGMFAGVRYEHVHHADRPRLPVRIAQLYNLDDAPISPRVR